MSDKPIRINKVGGTGPSRTKTVKSTRTYPKSSLRKTARKIEGVRDPSSSPPFKPGTLRILTSFGEKQRRRKTQGRIQSMTHAQVREKLRKSNLAVGPKTPPELAKIILEGGTEAGMIPQ
jgi:hypothetical protein